MLLVQPPNERLPTDRIALPGAPGLATTSAATDEAEHVTPVPPSVKATWPVDSAMSSVPTATRGPSGAPRVRTAFDADAPTGSMASTAARSVPIANCACLRTTPAPPDELAATATIQSLSGVHR